MTLMDSLNFGDNGLIPAVIQDEESKKVLTLCYMNRDALEKSLLDGRVWVYRRSRKKVMVKGETSGCFQRIKKVFMDCQNNSLLFQVRQEKAACHDGYFTCYFREIDKSGNAKIVEKRIFDPKDVY